MWPFWSMSGQRAWIETSKGVGTAWAPLFLVVIGREPRYPRPVEGIGTKSVLRGGRAPRYGRSMKSYGQFCSMARALDLLGERWSLLIVRELLCGSRRFGEIQRGIPRVSRTMLAARLRELAAAGVIERGDGNAGPEYRLKSRPSAPLK